MSEQNKILYGNGSGTQIYIVLTENPLVKKKPSTYKKIFIFCLFHLSESGYENRHYHLCSFWFLSLVLMYHRTCCRTLQTHKYTNTACLVFVKEQTQTRVDRDRYIHTNACMYIHKHMHSFTYTQWLSLNLPLEILFVKRWPARGESLCNTEPENKWKGIK